jgi:hypothetical protein
MGMASENMWNRPVSAIIRCSDDFKPENREWFIEHILQCSYNSFVQGSFYWCDWDMWWTDDGQAVKNAVLRAVSGGPIYISDKINRSIRKVIMPLIFSDGEILRCDRPAVPTRDCLIMDLEEMTTPFKVWNRCDSYGIVAAFNLNSNNKKVKGRISASDAEGLEGNEFVIYEHFSKDVKLLSRDECLDIVLDNQDDCKLYIIAPLQNGYSPLGLIDKYISPRSISNRIGMNVMLREGGLFAFFCKYEVQDVFVNGEKRPIERKENLYIVDCNDSKGNVWISIVRRS